jgi:hypothetical protein
MPIERALLALAVLATSLKVARDAGAPPPLFGLALLAAAATAVAGAVWNSRRGRGWLDGPRLVLVLLGLAVLPSVYARVGGDGFEYYALLRSPLLDQDLDFANDFAGLGARPVLSSDGEVTARTPVGMALLWLPAFLAAHAAALVLPGVPADGFGFLYQSAATSSTYAAAFAALLLLEALLRRLYDRGVALLAVLALWLATPLHYYMTANPSMSHGGSVFAATLFVVAWLRAREAGTSRAFVLCGLAGALVGLVRVQDFVLLALPLADLALTPRLRRPRLALALLAAPVAAGLLQLAVWAALYGGRLVRVVATQNLVGGSGLVVVDLLFAARHGLFTWTPLYLAAVLGWLGWLRRDRRLGALCLGGFALMVIVNGTLQDWWGSESFGQRRLLALTPLFALGLGQALAFTRRRPLVPAALGLALLAAWNLQFEGVFNSQVVANRRQAVTLDRLAGAQMDALFRALLRAERFLPRRVFLLAYDNLRGVWLDEGSRSLGGVIDLGSEPPDLSQVVGHNWYPPESEDGVTFRRSRDRRSWLRIPIRTPGDFTLALRGRSEVRGQPVGVRLELNGHPLGEVELGASWSEPAVAVPASAVRGGFNDLALLYSATPREALPDHRGRNAAIAVDAVRLERRAQP